MDKAKKKPLNSLSLATNHNSEMLINNFNTNKNKVNKILSEHLNGAYLHAMKKEKRILECNGSNTNLSCRSMSRPKNRSISENVLITIMDKGNKMHKMKAAIKKPKSTLCISNVKSESSEVPLYFKSYPMSSNDSLIASKPHFVKLKPLFDAGLKDPKISRLILSSKTLAGESDSSLHKARIHSDFRDCNAEMFGENQSRKNNVKSARVPEINTRSISEEKKVEGKHRYTSNRSIFSTDSIIYGNNAFQKIREKFDLIDGKVNINEQIQEQGSLNKQRLFTFKESWKKSYEGLHNGSNNSQSIDNNYNNNNNNMNKNARSSSFLMNVNPKQVSTVLFDKEGISEKKYLLLLPKTFAISNHQSEHSVKELSHNAEKEKATDFYSIHGKSIGIGQMNDEHKLININLRSSSSKVLYPSSSKNEIKLSEKGTGYTKSLSEKQTQVNMYSETYEKQVKDAISNEKSVTKNEEISAIVSGKVAQRAMLHDNSKAEASWLNNDDQNKTTKSNNNDQAEAGMSNNNIQPKGIMLNDDNQPVILYNSSGFPITDLNGRVLKNNLGAYLLNSAKYIEVITKKLPVFDCDLMSVSSTCFNPTKMPFVKVQYKITDRCENPVSLFNNVGWPLTNEDGFFLHDNRGKLLVEMDSFNFPLCCSNGSPIYLQNGAMLLSQKYKFRVSKPNSDSNNTIRSLKRNYGSKAVGSYDKKDNKSCSETPINSNIITRPPIESNSNFRKHTENPNFQYKWFLPTEVPELMHEFFDNKARPRFSNFRSQGCIPQSPIPIFDREGNRLTDENGFPLKNKYGEYMLLLDKNGIALSDFCGGPIFDSNGKQLWLKDLYHMKKKPSFNYLFDRYMPPEHPYIDNSTNNNYNTHDSSDDVIPLLDLNFENEHTSEPVMNYIKQNNIKAYDMDVNQIHFFNNKYCHYRRPKQIKFLKNVSIPTNEEHYLQPPSPGITENLLFNETRHYQDESEYRDLYDSFSEQIHDRSVPSTYEQSIYEDILFSEEDPQVDNLEQYDNNYDYYDQGFPENAEFHSDSEIQYYIDDDNYVMYY
nr:protein PFF0380w-like [Halyomorpha halys]